MLFVASQNGHVEVIKLLLQHGADVYDKNKVSVIVFRVFVCCCMNLILMLCGLVVSRMEGLL